MPRQLWNDKKRLNKLFRGKGEAEVVSVVKKNEVANASPPQCPSCGTPMKRTGAPEWEEYCPNMKCEGEAPQTSNEPTDEEVRHYHTQRWRKPHEEYIIIREADIARHFYRLGYEKGKHFRCDAVNQATKEAEQRGYEKGCMDTFSKITDDHNKVYEKGRQDQAVVDGKSYEFMKKELINRGIRQLLETLSKHDIETYLKAKAALRTSAKEGKEE